MKKEILNKFIRLTPDSDYLTNGDTYSTEVYMPLNADTSVWHDATQEEKDTWEKERQVTIMEEMNYEQ